MSLSSVYFDRDMNEWVGMKRNGERVYGKSEGEVVRAIVLHEVADMWELDYLLDHKYPEAKKFFK
jgi:hypothetical protein